MKAIICILLFISFSSFGQSLYKTPSGSKYHLGNCRMVKNVSSKIDIETAKRMSACKICKPPSFGKITYSSSNKAKGKSKSTQCTARTKKGTRCKHMTSISGGRCYQHN